MAAIDSILGIAIQQGATELRVGTDREPEMYRGASRLRLALDPTPDDTLRLLLGPLLGAEAQATLQAQGSVEFPHEVQGVGSFHVVMTRREANEAAAGIDVVFHVAGARGEPASAVPTRAVSAAAEEPIVREVLFTSGATAAAMGTAPSPRVAYGRRPGQQLAALLEHAVALRASDLHLRQGEPPALRIDGRLQSILADPVADLSELLGDSMRGAVDEARTTGRSIDAAFEVAGTGRFRLNVYMASARACPGKPPRG